MLHFLSFIPSRVPVPSLLLSAPSAHVSFGLVFVGIDVCPPCVNSNKGSPSTMRFLLFPPPGLHTFGRKPRIFWLDFASCIRCVPGGYLVFFLLFSRTPFSAVSFFQQAPLFFFAKTESSNWSSPLLNSGLHGDYPLTPHLFFVLIEVLYPDPLEGVGRSEPILQPIFLGSGEFLALHSNLSTEERPDRARFLTRSFSL